MDRFDRQPHAKIFGDLRDLLQGVAQRPTRVNARGNDGQDPGLGALGRDDHAVERVAPRPDRPLEGLRRFLQGVEPRLLAGERREDLAGLVLGDRVLALDGERLDGPRLVDIADVKCLSNIDRVSWDTFDGTPGDAPKNGRVAAGGTLS